MNYFELFTYIGFVPLLIFIIAVNSVVFLFICKSKNERQWNKRFYPEVPAGQFSRVSKIFLS